MSEFMKLQRKQMGSHSSVFPTPDSSPTTPHVSPAPTIAHNFSQVSVLPKFEVSQPHDPAEQEADRAADQIMRMPDPINTEQMVMRSLHETIHRSSDARVMRYPAETQAQDFGFDNVEVSLAVDKEADSIGHAWIIIDTPDGAEDSYGFWPKSFSILGSLALGWYDGQVVHPDKAHVPNALFSAMTDQKGLEKGIDYAESNKTADYHLLFFNCSTFARKMFEIATGKTAPSGGLVIDSPNELAERIAEKNTETDAPTPASNVSPPSPPVPIQPKLASPQLVMPQQGVGCLTDETMKVQAPEWNHQKLIRSLQRSSQRHIADESQKGSEQAPSRTELPNDRVAEQVNQVMQSGGQPLNQDIRNFMEPRFRFDFSQVRIHRDAEATESAKSIQAHAYTVGQDIVFASGQYKPDTDSGKQLLAHELTHVVQQTGGLQTKESLQRSESDEDQATPPVSTDSSAGVEPFDIQISFSMPEPIDIPSKDLDDQGPGDYPLPGDSTYAMAKLVDGALLVQRDDNDKPHPSADAQGQGTLGLVSPTDPPAPWSLQGTLVYRNINIGQLTNPQNKPWLDFGHEPNISLALDSQGGVSVQEAMTLINWHWTPPWNKDLEVGLQAAATQTILPKLSSAYGGGVQAEQHIIPSFSVTLSLNGTLTPAQRGEKGTFAVTGNLGVLVHFDGF